jgi:hypothetical protein
MTNNYRHLHFNIWLLLVLAGISCLLQGCFSHSDPIAKPNLVLIINQGEQLAIITGMKRYDQ